MILGQIFRYTSVGALTNLTAYLLYLALTWKWLQPEQAVSLTYPFGAAMAYFGQARFVFSQNVPHKLGMPRYIFSHVLGYLLNLSVLYVLVDRLSFPHQLVQIFAIVMVALFLFLLSKFFVFREKGQ